MKQCSILLNTIDKVKDFCNRAGKIEGDLDIVSGRFLVDGKSIMGVFSLDISRPLTLVAEDNVDFSALRDFMV